MTDEEIVVLMRKLKSVQPNIRFKITGREDASNIIQVVKLLILIYRWDNNEDEFVFANDYSSFTRKVKIIPEISYHKMAQLPEGYTVKKIAAKRNYVWEKQEEFIYEIFKDKKLIAVETC